MFQLDSTGSSFLYEACVRLASGNYQPIQKNTTNYRVVWVLFLVFFLALLVAMSGLWMVRNYHLVGPLVPCGILLFYVFLLYLLGRFVVSESGMQQKGVGL